MMNRTRPSHLFRVLAVLGGLTALGYEALQLSFISFEQASEAHFLNGEVIQIAAIGEEDLGLDHCLSNSFILLVGELGCELAATDGVDAGFECGNPFEA